MPRTIKFRAWDGGNMFYNDNTALLAVQRSMFGIVGQEPELVLMQFTGITDKNGREIYEGDVLKPVNPPSPKKFNRSVEFVEGSFCYSLTGHQKEKYIALSRYKARLFEVVGNVYENPELLSSPEV